MACCKTLLDPRAQFELDRLIGEVDLTQLVISARRHRVEGLVWSALRPLASETAAPALQPLSDAARNISLQGLRAAAESARIQDAFATAGIDLLFLKGLAVGQIAYGNPFLKMSWDIDVLVHLQDIRESARQLLILGYRCDLEDQHVDLTQWHLQNKESVWHSHNGVHHVELHSRLADNRELIPTIGMASPRQVVAVASGISLPTLATEELFAYLCVHGASSAWFRLKWVADLAGLLRNLDSAEIERLYRRSQSLGAMNASAQALMVADVLFQLRLSPDLRNELKRTAGVRFLTAAALRELTQEQEPTSRRLGTAMIHLSQLLLKSDLSFSWREFRRQLLVAFANWSTQPIVK